MHPGRLAAPDGLGREGLYEEQVAFVVAALVAALELELAAPSSASVAQEVKALMLPGHLSAQEQGRAQVQEVESALALDPAVEAAVALASEALVLALEPALAPA